MSFRRWLTILIVAGVVCGAFLVGIRLSGLNATTSGTAGNAARDPAASPASSAATSNGATSVANGRGVAVAAGASNVTAAASGADLFKHHADLVKAQQAVWDHRARVKSAGVPAETLDLFREWAMVLYRDSLLVGMGRLPVTDPVAQELEAALRTDTEPRLAMVQKASLGMIPESRTTNLLFKVAALQGIPDLPETLWMGSEFEHLLKKAKQRSDSHYMSEMKMLFSHSQATVEEKIAFVDRFVEIRDVTLAEYPQEYFQQLLQENTLNSDQQIKVQGLLQRISQVRTP